MENMGKVWENMGRLRNIWEDMGVGTYGMRGEEKMCSNRRRHICTDSLIVIFPSEAGQENTRIYPLVRTKD